MNPSGNEQTGSASVIIRQAQLSDAETVQRISADAYTAAYLAVIGAVPAPATEDYRSHIKRGAVWMAEVRGEPRGVIVLSEKPGYVLIYSVAVTPEHQGKGYAKALLSFADRQALAIGARAVRLFTNRRMKRNLSLYRRCGFREIGARPHPSRAGEVLIDMEKRIAFE
jgi:ribosomal protein S18 acetylase RimI-like enzyme